MDGGPYSEVRPMYQTIIVDELRNPYGRIDWLEIIRAMPADGKSRIEFGELSETANPVSEFMSAGVH